MQCAPPEVAVFTARDCPAMHIEAEQGDFERGGEVKRIMQPCVNLVLLPCGRETAGRRHRDIGELYAVAADRRGTGLAIGTGNVREARVPAVA